MRASKHQTVASRVFSIGSWSAGLWPATSSAGLMVDLGLNNSYPALLWTHIFSSVKGARANGRSRPQEFIPPWSWTHLLFREKGESVTMFLVLSAATADECLDFWGMLRFCSELKILVVHRTTGFEHSGGLIWFLRVSDHRTTIIVESWTEFSCHFEKWPPGHVRSKFFIQNNSLGIYSTLVKFKNNLHTGFETLEKTKSGSGAHGGSAVNAKIVSIHPNQGFCGSTLLKNNDF